MVVTFQIRPKTSARRTRIVSVVKLKGAISGCNNISNSQVVLKDFKEVLVVFLIGGSIII